MTHKAGESSERLDDGLDVASLEQVDRLKQLVLGQTVLPHALLYRCQVLHQRKVAALRVDLLHVARQQFVHQPADHTGT